MNRLGHLTAVTCAVALSFGAGACGDDNDSDKGSSAAATATAAPEDVLAPDAEVTTGLGDLVKVAATVATKQDSDESKKAAEGLEPVWMKVEGTVKKNEPDLYATIEEDLSLLESGDSKKTAAGAAEIAETVAAYLAKHPG
jgi:hypothetical protein